MIWHDYTSMQIHIWTYMYDYMIHAYIIDINIYRYTLCRASFAHERIAVAKCAALGLNPALWSCWMYPNTWQLEVQFPRWKMRFGRGTSSASAWESSRWKSGWSDFAVKFSENWLVNALILVNDQICLPMQFEALANALILVDTSLALTCQVHKGPNCNK